MYRLMRINLLILLLFSIFHISEVNAYVEPTTDFYVNDYANILSLETEKYILKKSQELNAIDGTQIVVVTIPSLEGESIEEYSLNLARNYKIGSKEKNNGLLLLLALKEREFRVEVGTGLEGILPDGKTGRFQDQYMIPYFKNNDFDTGIKEGYNAFFNEIVRANNLNLQTDEPKPNMGTPIPVENILIFGVVGYIIGIIFRLISLLKNKITMVYIIISIIAIIFLQHSESIYIMHAMLQLVGFVIGRFNSFVFTGGHTGGSGGSSHYHSSHSSSHRSSSSHGGSFGGGGSFSGGGSSRHF